MPQLRLTFRVPLETWELPEFGRPNGALFHRWIPNGKDDAITLTAPNEINCMSVWFDRRARIRDGFLEYNHDGSEFDENIMVRQGKLDGGPLRGEVLLNDLSETELAEIQCKSVSVGSPANEELVAEAPLYAAAGKRLVTFIQPRLSKFIGLLKSQFGQYWLRDLRPWDSRHESLGSYCTGLGLIWWHQSTQQGFRFVPTAPAVRFTASPPPGRGYAEYLTKDDWLLLQQMTWGGDLPTELKLLGRANQAADQEDYRYAFVEAGVALELAVERRVSPPGQSAIVQSALQAFDRHPDKSRLAVVLTLAGWDNSSIEKMLAALELRNRVVHKGYQPDVKDVAILRDFMDGIARLMGLAEFKLPVLTSSNRLGPPK